MVLVCCTRIAPLLLVHVSLVLAIITGAGLATLARLKWDPSTYLLVRTLLPTEYRVLSGVLCFGTFFLIALAHMVIIALSIRSKSHYHIRQAMILAYGALMIALILVELGTIAWLCVRIVKFLQTEEAKYFINKLWTLFNEGPEIIEKVGILTDYAGPLKILRQSMSEIMHDIPYNVYVAIVFIIFTAVLQPLSVVLAWNAAFTYIKDPTHESTTTLVHTIRYNSNQRKPSIPPPVTTIPPLRNNDTEKQ